MLKIAALGFTIAASAISMAAGDDRSTQLDDYQKSQTASLAFQCADWANVDEGRSIKLTEVGRLSLYGYELESQASLVETTPMGIAAAKGFGPLNQRAPVDFWVGVEWELAIQAVNRGLDYNVPQGDHTFPEWQVLRAANASKNFFEQGCDKLGLPD